VFLTLLLFVSSGDARVVGERHGGGEGVWGSRTGHTLLTSVIGGHRRSGMIAAVSLRLLYPC
jgi:hypothetical protein